MDVGGRKKNWWVDMVGSKNFFLWVDMGECSRWALVDVQTKITHIHPRPTASTHCGWTWVDMVGLGWTWVDVGGRGWTCVDVCGRVWTWVDMVGLGWT